MDYPNNLQQNQTNLRSSQPIEFPTNEMRARRGLSTDPDATGEPKLRAQELRRRVIRQTMRQPEFQKAMSKLSKSTDTSGGLNMRAQIAQRVAKTDLKELDKLERAARGATKLLLNSTAEDDYFMEHYKATLKDRNRIDVPIMFRASSDVEADSVLRLRDRLRRNTFEHMKFHTGLQSPTGAKLFKGVYGRNEPFPREDLTKRFSEYAYARGNHEGLPIKLFELFTEACRVDFGVRKVGGDKAVHQEEPPSKPGVARFLRELSALRADNLGRALSQEKWGHVHDAGEDLARRVLPEGDSFRSTRKRMEQLIEDGYFVATRKKASLTTDRHEGNEAAPEGEPKGDTGNQAISDEVQKLVSPEENQASPEKQEAASTGEVQPDDYCAWNELANAPDDSLESEENQAGDGAEQNAVQMLKDESGGLPSTLNQGSTEYGTAGEHYRQQTHRKTEVDTLVPGSNARSHQDIREPRDGVKTRLPTEHGGDFSGFNAFTDDDRYEGMSSPHSPPFLLQQASRQLVRKNGKRDLEIKNQSLIPIAPSPRYVRHEDASKPESMNSQDEHINIKQSNYPEYAQIPGRNPDHLKSQDLQVPASHEFILNEQSSMVDEGQRNKTGKRYRLQKMDRLNQAINQSVDTPNNGFRMNVKTQLDVHHPTKESSELLPPIKFRQQSNLPIQLTNFDKNARRRSQIIQSYAHNKEQIYQRYLDGELSNTIDCSQVNIKKEIQNFVNIKTDLISSRASRKGQRLLPTSLEQEFRLRNGIRSNLKTIDGEVRALRAVHPSPMGSCAPSQLIHKNKNKREKQYRASSTTEEERSKQKASPHIHPKRQVRKVSKASPMRLSLDDILTRCGDKRIEERKSAQMHTLIEKTLNSLNDEANDMQEIYADYCGQFEIEAALEQPSSTVQQQGNRKAKLFPEQNPLQDYKQLEETYRESRELDYANFTNKEEIKKLRKSTGIPGQLGNQRPKPPKIWKPAQLVISADVLKQLESSGLQAM